MPLVSRFRTCPIHGLQPHTEDAPNHVLHAILTVLFLPWAVVWIVASAKTRASTCQACLAGVALGAARSPLALPPGSTPVPPPRIKPTSELPQLAISVVADSSAGLFVTVRNERGAPVRLLWDESTCTGPGGRTLGRLIKKGHVAATVQPASPIVPRAALVDSCIPEHGLPFGATGYGQLYLVFETDLGKETWQAAVTFGTPESAPAGEPYRG